MDTPSQITNYGNNRACPRITNEAGADNGGGGGVVAPGPGALPAEFAGRVAAKAAGVTGGDSGRGTPDDVAAGAEFAARRDKISRALPPEELERFCACLLSLPPGQRTLARIQALAAGVGVNVSIMGASRFRDGALADRAAQIRAKAAHAAQIAQLAAEGQTLTSAAAARLKEITFDVLMDGAAADMESEDLERHSRTLARLQAAEQRDAALAQREAMLAADLRLARERADTLAQQRLTVKSRLKEQIATLEKAVKTNPADVAGNTRLMQAVVEIIDTL